MNHQDTNLPLITQLERLAANTWPAAESRRFGDWRLRATFGVTRRANSVFAIGSPPAEANWRTEIESFYREKSLPVRFHVSPASPSWLDAELEAQGYVADSHTSMLVADAGKARQLLEPADRFQAMLYEYANEEWLHTFLTCEGYSEDRIPAYERIFAGIEPAHRFAVFLDRGTPVAVGTVVVESGWAGFTNIAVAEPYRRRGVGLQLMRKLIDWANEREAENLYLQVMKNNEAALRLYAKLGFRHLFDYHYRVESR
ncbi:GNAT family N-acetyltransferase [Paenibacillus sp. MBLB4367]|uniref:GNAT family N-acetyltransferase n=1 Tax=Paenibacillus sp. MBLB4367 TaxID=3384767 RepID=UPI00390811FD